jgi:hypothetical protein
MHVLMIEAGARDAIFAQKSEISITVGLDLLHPSSRYFLKHQPSWYPLLAALYALQHVLQPLSLKIYLWL